MANADTAPVYVVLGTTDDIRSELSRREVNHGRSPAPGKAPWRSTTVLTSRAAHRKEPTT